MKKKKAPAAARSGTVKKSDTGLGLEISQEEALRMAVGKAQKAMAKKPSKESVENFTAINDALDDFLAKKDGTDPDPEERRFKNMLEVVEYLKGQGWKIEKTKAYADKKAGKIKAQPDGSFLMSDVDRYIVKVELKKADGTDPATDTQNRKAEASAKKEESQARWWDIKADVESGKYVPKEQMEYELAARAAYLRTDLENFIRSHAAEMVAIVDGDPGKTPELLDFYLNALADWLNRYAKQKEFSGPGPVPSGC